MAIDSGGGNRGPVQVRAYSAVGTACPARTQVPTWHVRAARRARAISLIARADSGIYLII